MLFLAYLLIIGIFLYLRAATDSLSRELDSRKADAEWNKIELKRVEKRAADLTARIFELEQRLSAGEVRVPAPAAKQEPEPNTEPVVEPAPPPEPQSETPTPAATTTQPQPEPEPKHPEPTPPSAAPPPAAPPPEPWTPPAEPKPAIDFEQFVGVRGAAILGGIVLALAALLFVRYSIEQGLVTPAIRIGFGILAGLGCLAGSRVMRSRGYEAADAVAGAGFTALYGSLWAGWKLYDFWPAGAAFAGMAAVTAGCVYLAWIHRSKVVAGLSLFGGFATPVLVSTGSDRPFVLFGYLLLVNGEFLVLSRRTRVPMLAFIALVLTMFYQGHWIFEMMGPSRLWLGAAVATVFTVLFAVVPLTFKSDDESAAEWPQIQAAGFAMPLLAALYFASSPVLDAGLYPSTLLLGILGVGASLLARRVATPHLPLAIAAASVVVVGAWLPQAIGPQGDWLTEFLVCTLGLAVLHHLLFEFIPAPEDQALSPAVATSAGGAGLVAFAAMVSPTPAFWSWLVGLLVLCALGLRQAVRLPAPVLITLFAALSAGGLTAYGWFGEPAVGAVTFSAVAVTLTAVTLAAAERVEEDFRAPTEHAGALFASVFLFLWTSLAGGDQLGAVLFYPISIALMALATISQVTRRIPILFSLFVVMTAVGHGMHLSVTDGPERLIWPTLALFAVGACYFGLGDAFRREHPAIRTAATATVWWFPLMADVWNSEFGNGAIGLLPVLLAGLSGAYYWLAPIIGPVTDPAGLLYRVWHGGVAVTLLAVAVPMQLDDEWVTIGWALQGAALIWLWTRLDHWGLKYYGAALLLLATARLWLDPNAAFYHERSGMAVFNWLMYAYLTPAAALLFASWKLAPLEVERRLDREPTWGYPNGPALAALLGGMALTTIFIWINLTIFDAFSTGREIQFDLERQATRDLVLSLAWGVYALALLAGGVLRGLRSLRWTSLLMMLATVCKVFLYDLGELEDLYRVASLVGLAFALILISLAYQRFVFGTAKTEQS